MNKTKLFLGLKNYQKCVGFSEKEHLYYYKSRTLTSVTTLIKNFFPKFNFNNETAKKCAEKDGVSVTQVLENWKSSSDFGTLVHSKVEELLWNRDLGSLVFENSRVEDYCSSAYDFISEFEPSIVYTELCVWDSEFSVAGTIDFLTYNSVTGKLDIWDWKTNNSIVDKSVNFGKFGFGVLASIPDTNFWHYALQLSVYKYILIKHGFEIGDLRLVHLSSEGYRVIEVPYLSDEAYLILKSQQE